MDKNRLKEEEIAFLEIGEHKKDKEVSAEKPINFDGRQYSIKIPMKFMNAIDFKKGDSLLFKLVKPFDAKKKPYLEIEYKRK